MWALISERVHSNGPMTFSEFQDLALYHPQAGFYSTQGSAGRGADFLTSPEVGPLFGRVIANAMDKWWRQLGKPNPFFFIEVGAGIGTLAAYIVECELECADALRYVAVERSALLRSEQAMRIQVQYPETVLNSKPPPYRSSSAPMIASIPELPKGPLTGVIFANELLDNLPVDLYERRSNRWYQCCVGISNRTGLTEVFEPVDEETQAILHSLAPAASDGARVPLQVKAMEWLQDALDTLDRGRVVCIDYAHTTNWMANHNWEDWLRTYRNHRPGAAPLDSPGSQDITCEVAIDQLAHVRVPDVDRSQTDFLEAYGLADLVSEAREAWHNRAAVGNLGSVRARARVNEGRALTDHIGLGGYRVFEWIIPEHAEVE